MFFDLLAVYSIPYLLIPALLVVLLWVAVARPERIRWPWMFRIALSMVALSLILLPALLTFLAVLGLGVGGAPPPELQFGRPNPIESVGRLLLAAGAGAYFCMAVLLAISSLHTSPAGNPNRRPIE